MVVTERILYSQITAEEKVMSLATEKCFSGLLRNFQSFALALINYSYLPSDANRRRLFLNFQFYKNGLKCYSPSIYYIMLEWKDVNIKYLRQYIVEE